MKRLICSVILSAIVAAPVLAAPPPPDGPLRFRKNGKYLILLENLSGNPNFPCDVGDITIPTAATKKVFETWVLTLGEGQVVLCPAAAVDVARGAPGSCQMFKLKDKLCTLVP